MKTVALFLIVALAGCGRSDQSWAEGDTTAFPLTTPGTPLKVERAVIRLPAAPVALPEEGSQPQEDAPEVESLPAPVPPPEPPPAARDTGQALLL